ncbi:myxoma growth factor [Myxoma virus]|nr:myxoma growth factor [Myxoma virus]
MVPRDLVATLLCAMCIVQATMPSLDNYLYIIKRIKLCNDDYKNYCLNNGTCFTVALNNVSLNPFCACRINYVGSRCQFINLITIK